MDALTAALGSSAASATVYRSVVIGSQHGPGPQQDSPPAWTATLPYFSLMVSLSSWPIGPQPLMLLVTTKSNGAGPRDKGRHCPLKRNNPAD